MLQNHIKFFNVAVFKGNASDSSIGMGPSTVQSYLPAKGRVPRRPLPVANFLDNSIILASVNQNLF